MQVKSKTKLKCNYFQLNHSVMRHFKNVYCVNLQTKLIWWQRKIIIVSPLQPKYTNSVSLRLSALTFLSSSDSADTMDVVLLLIWQVDVNHWRKMKWAVLYKNIYDFVTTVGPFYFEDLKYLSYGTPWTSIPLAATSVQINSLTYFFCKHKKILQHK